MSDVPAHLQSIDRMIDQGRYEQARAALTRVLAGNPRDDDGTMLMVYLCGKMGDLVRACFYAEKAVSLLPDDPRAHANLVLALGDCGRHAEAVAAAERAAARLPDSPEIAGSLVMALGKAERLAAALREAERAAERWGDGAQLQNAASMALNTGHAARSVEWWRRGVRAVPDNPVLASGLVSTLNYSDRTDPGEIRPLLDAYAAILSRALGPPSDRWNVTPDPERPLRVGVLSPDFRRHATSYFIRPFLEHHDRNMTEIVCFSTSTIEDEVSSEMRSLVSGWRRTPKMLVTDLHRVIVEERIDVLIDLAGHTLGNALGSLHLKAAPVQMTWIGYPASTGVPSVDYRIVDSLSDPPDEPWTGPERPLRIDPCFLVYRPPASAPPVAPCPFDSTGHITFGSFSAIQKVTDSTVRMWTRVLRAVPGSRLLYKAVALKDPLLVEIVRDRFAAAGADTDRVMLEPPGDGALEMMRQYSRVDISLDTFPYHGTTTTCESAWMGVPMVALRGRWSAARVNCSLLSAVGLGDLVAGTEDEFVELAAGLAADRERLTRLRSPGPEGLRVQMAASPLRDEVGATRRLETAIRACWREWCASLAR